MSTRHPIVMRNQRRSQLGARVDETGVHFALRSHSASQVTLCWFDTERGNVEARIDMVRGDDGLWTAHVPNAGPGLQYGYRVSGSWDPSRALFHNSQKLLLDPYARMVAGPLTFHSAQACYGDVTSNDTRQPDRQDSATVGLRSVVIDDAFDWQDDHAPNIPWRDTVLYECHVKGMTAQHPTLADSLRGTYLGLGSEPVIEHLRALGVTTLSLMPVAVSYTEQRLVEAGLLNYWGYQPIAWFAPTPLYASAPGREVNELKATIRTLHRAGIEVVLDMVFNHSGEGPSHGASAGPSLSLRGIDPDYYRRDPHDRSRDQDFTGCGNTLDLRAPITLQWVMDCLRYWAQEFHVDGFRLDLAPALCRGDLAFDRRAPLLMAIQQDPLLRDLKWIAEPWDLGPDGYCLGRFPRGVREWNDRFREGVRRYVRHDGDRGELARRLAASSDVFDHDGRSATSSINYVTCHDGFTLWDLVSYSRKHNAANREDNRDGREHNSSHNWGVEGDTRDLDVLETRRRVASSMLVALACAQGVPMFSHGDELGRTQGGNNNAYCQDNALTYVDWAPLGARASLLGLTRTLFTIRREHPALRQEAHSHGELVPGTQLPNVSWIGRDGQVLQTDQWHDVDDPVLGMLRCADNPKETTQPDVVLAVWNPSREACEVSLPALPLRGHFVQHVDTSLTEMEPCEIDRREIVVAAHCAAVLTWKHVT